MYLFSLLTSFLVVFLYKMTNKTHVWSRLAKKFPFLTLKTDKEKGTNQTVSCLGGSPYIDKNKFQIICKKIFIMLCLKNERLLLKEVTLGKIINVSRKSHNSMASFMGALPLFLSLSRIYSGVPTKRGTRHFRVPFIILFITVFLSL